MAHSNVEPGQYIFRGKLSRKMCGDWSAKLKLLRYVTQGTVMGIHFVSDYSHHFSGYKAKITMESGELYLLIYLRMSDLFFFVKVLFCTFLVSECLSVFIYLSLYAFKQFPFPLIITNELSHTFIFYFKNESCTGATRKFIKNELRVSENDATCKI